MKKYISNGSNQSSDKNNDRRINRKIRIQKFLQIFGYPSSFFGFYSTLQLVRKGDIQEAIISGTITCCITVLAIVSKVASLFFESIFNRIEIRIEKVLESFSEWLVTKGESQIVWNWWKITSNFRVKYYRYLTDMYQTYKTTGLQKQGAYIPALAKIFTTPKVAPVNPKIAKIFPIPFDEVMEGVEIWNYLAGTTSKQSGYNRMLILGAPGSGKTTLLEELALTYAQNQQRKRHPKAPKLIPILLLLREIQSILKEKSNLRLSKIIAEKLSRTTDLDAQDKWFENKLKSGQCLVMLDGLDEVQEDYVKDSDQPSVLRQLHLTRIGRWIDKQILHYPSSVFIITSRPFAYEIIQLQGVRLSLKIQPFNLLQVEEFIGKWYLENEIMRRGQIKANSSIRQAAKRSSDDLVKRIKGFPALTSMSFNPLLLTMIAIVHAEVDLLPGSRVELYAEICDVFLGRREAAKELGGLDRDQRSIPLTRYQKKLVLQTLALGLMENGLNGFSIDDGERIIKGPLESVSSLPINPRYFLGYIKDYVGLIIEAEDDFYEFCHLSFQEYLAAFHIKEINAENILIANISNPRWKETIRLYAAMSNADAIISTAIHSAIEKFKSTKCNSTYLLGLAFDCLDECKSVSPEIREKMVSWLEKGLNSSNMDFRDAAQKIRVHRMLYGTEKAAE